MVLEDLYRMVDQNLILVFPTEESARAFSVSYVLERKKGILASSVIAFDRFAEQFYHDGGTAEASDADKLIFASYASSRMGDKLRYFASPDHPELRSRLSGTIGRMLGSIAEAGKVSIRNSDAVHDILLIDSCYRSFLDESSLSDRTFSDFDIHDTGRSYALVMPSAFPKEWKLAEALSGVPGIIMADDFPPVSGRLSLYHTEKEELRALFIAIRKLLDDGVPFSDIIITASDPERLAPYLEEESFLHDIPLRFVSGSSPLDSSSGKFFSMLRDIYDTSYSLNALKALLLDPSMPFSSPDTLRHFIYRAVEDAITSAPDIRSDRYMKIPEEAGGRIYAGFRKLLDSLMAEKRPGKIVPLVHAISSLLFVPEEFSLRDEDAEVYSFAMNELSLFLSRVEAAENAGFRLDVPLFPLFIEYLGNRRYVPKTKKDGIRVYPFGQDAAIPVKYRFMIALNEEECGRTVRDASFLSDYELSEKREEREITEDILRAYQAMSGTLTLSASSETYSGTMLPLMILDRDDAVLPVEDPWRSECRMPSGMIYPLQRDGYMNAVYASLDERDYADDVTYSGKGLRLGKPLRLSFSSADSYEHCPYMHALQYRFSLSDLRPYTPETMDHLEIGSRLHSVMERFYKEGGRLPESRIPVLFDEEMALWKDGKRFEDGEIREMRKSSTRPSGILISYLRSMYLDNLIEAAVRMNGISSPIPGFGLEEKLQREFPELGFSIYGIIDRIAVDEDGKGILFDYKKGRRFSASDRERKGLQFYIYRLLAETGSPVYPERAFFVTLRDCAFSEVSLDDGDGDILHRLSADAEGIKNGRWEAISSDENCQGCLYRGICRRRFSIR